MKFSDERRTEYRRSFSGLIIFSLMGASVILSAVLTEYFYGGGFYGMQRPSDNVVLATWVGVSILFSSPLVFFSSEA